METGYHLPHNAVIVDEFKFMLSLLNLNEEYYLYDDLKAMFFEEMVRQDLFPEFHKGLYKRIMASNNMRHIYIEIKDGKKNYDDIKRLYYTDRDKKPSKNFNQNWNEYVRDYLEFMAFLGLLPTYYKGKNRESDKKHYISDTLIKYLNKEIKLKEVLLGMKFRNASKDYGNFIMYDITLRPFVVALKILQYAKERGYCVVDGAVLGGLVKFQKNEKLNDFDDINFSDRSKNGWSKKQIKEFGRSSTFMKQWLNTVLEIPLVKGKTIKYDISNFDINKYNIYDKVIFVGEKYHHLEITPQIANVIINPNKTLNQEIINILELNGLINDNKQNVHINFDTDLPSRELVLEALNIRDSNEIINFDFDNENFKTANKLIEDFETGFKIAKSSDGTAYENFVHNQLEKTFKNFTVRKLGSQFTGQRISDAVVDCVVYHHQTKSNIKIIVECKAGKSIKSFDERKEMDNVSNTLNFSDAKEYDGVWYIITDSDQIKKPRHGGYRTNNNSFSFEEKLLNLQFDIQMRTGKPTIVTAFSYEMFMNFLYQIRDINGIITSQSTKNFWVWSKQFVNRSYISIQA